MYKVAVKADSWQERQFAGYCSVIAHLSKFGIAAPSPNKSVLGWGTGKRNEWYVKFLSDVH
jgi:hypothetical protein